ncbi:hypothetical protein B0T10DRAFT_565402 [Thelonectria olida]|uniref:Ndc10 domain-containing protein n=1 Tax=Thelonectria olida TaxID=1576542 RepID=A0A9P8VW97_9HYPO|nr:hypothetical protein B0T10DRAFT_565402 [Thelonectria olida]
MRAAHELKQTEFRDFCERKQYQNADASIEDKLLLFLTEEVADRPLRAKSLKAAEETPQLRDRYHRPISYTESAQDPNKPFLDLSRRSAFYDSRLITRSRSGRDRTAALLYNLQQDWVVRAFAYASIALRKKMHIGWSSGAKTAKLKGISKDQIRQAGR